MLTLTHEDHDIFKTLNIEYLSLRYQKGSYCIDWEEEKGYRG